MAKEKEGNRHWVLTMYGCALFRGSDPAPYHFEVTAVGSWPAVLCPVICKTDNPPPDVFARHRLSPMPSAAPYNTAPFICSLAAKLTLQKKKDIFVIGKRANRSILLKEGSKDCFYVARQEILV